MSNPIGLTVGQPFNPYKLFVGIFIPEALAVNPEVSPGAKLIFGQLARYAGSDGDCRPAVKTLGEKVGLKERQTQYHIRELETHGFLATVKRFKAPNVPDTNAYEFLWHESFNASVRAPGVAHSTAPGVAHSTAPGVVHPTAPGVVHSTAPGVVHSTAPKDSPLEDSQLKDSERTIKATAKHLHENHPSHRRGGLSGVETALRDVAKADERPVPEVMEEVRRQHARWLKSKNWDGEYVHGLVKWLADGKWHDDPTPKQAAQPGVYDERGQRVAYEEILDGGARRSVDGTIRYEDGRVVPPRLEAGGRIVCADGRILYRVS